MDGSRFDELTRAMALKASRRASLKSGLALLTGGLMAGNGAIAEARRSSSTTTAPPAVCPEGMTDCGGECCDAGMGCCGGVCCSQEQCGWQSAVCCPAETAVCGADCCHEGQDCCDTECCDGVCYGEERCCPHGQEICDGSCCAPGQSCCGDGCCDGVCANQGQTCCATGNVCNDSCCDGGQTCCGDGCCAGTCTEQGHLCCENVDVCNDSCCVQGQSCCGDGCCDGTCTNGNTTCCTSENVCNDGCCEDGQNCCGDGCCDGACLDQGQTCCDVANTCGDACCDQETERCCTANSESICVLKDGGCCSHDQCGSGSCGGTCDSSTHTCIYPSAGSYCGPSSCLEGDRSRSVSCDGRGLCVEDIAECGELELCSDGACTETCAESENCASGLCEENGACCPVDYVCEFEVAECCIASPERPGHSCCRLADQDGECCFCAGGDSYYAPFCCGDVGTTYCSDPGGDWNLGTCVKTSYYQCLSGGGFAPIGHVCTGSGEEVVCSAPCCGNLCCDAGTECVGRACLPVCSGEDCDTIGGSCTTTRELILVARKGSRVPR